MIIDGMLAALRGLDSGNDEISGRDVKFFAEIHSVLEMSDSACFSAASDFIRESFLVKARSLTHRLFRPRFMTEPVRSLMRSSKKSAVISSKEFYLEACLGWSSLPDDFFNPLQGSIELNEAILSLESIGCASLASSARKRISVMDEEFKGFRRMSVFLASSIMAKIHGYEPARNGADCLLLKREKSHVFRSLACPLHLMSDLSSHRVLEVVEKSDADGIFDHYIAVSPLLCNSDGSLSSQRKAVSEKIVNPAVLGEREGVCYFLGLFF